MQVSNSSGSLAAGTTAVVARPCKLTAVLFNPGSAASTITIYDNATAASGKVIYTSVAAANSNTVPFAADYPVECLNGITVVVAGTAATAVVHFSLE